MPERSAILVGESEGTIFSSETSRLLKSSALDSRRSPMSPVVVTTAFRPLMFSGDVTHFNSVACSHKNIRYTDILFHYIRVLLSDCHSELPFRRVRNCSTPFSRGFPGSLSTDPVSVSFQGCGSRSRCAFGIKDRIAYFQGATNYFSAQIGEWG